MILCCLICAKYACGAAQGDISKAGPDMSKCAKTTPMSVRNPAEDPSVHQQEPACALQETPSSVAKQGLQSVTTIKTLVCDAQPFLACCSKVYMLLSQT